MAVSKIRMLVLVLFPVLAIGLILSTTASATQWLINGTPFAGAEKISVKVQVPGDLVNLKSTLSGGATIIIGCNAVEAIGGEIFGNNKNDVTSIRFATCKIDASGCKLTPKEETEIKTSGVSSTAADLGGTEPVYDSFRSTAAAEEFVPITITGCAGEGIYHINGVSSCEVLAPRTNAVIKLCQFKSFSLLGTLHFGAQNATIEGTVGFSLAGTNQGKPWGVNP